MAFIQRKPTFMRLTSSANSLSSCCSRWYLCSTDSLTALRSPTYQQIYITRHHHRLKHKHRLISQQTICSTANSKPNSLVSTIQKKQLLLLFPLFLYYTATNSVTLPKNGSLTSSACKLHHIVSKYVSKFVFMQQSLEPKLSEALS